MGILPHGYLLLNLRSTFTPFELLRHTIISNVLLRFGADIIPFSITTMDDFRLDHMKDFIRNVSLITSTLKG